MDIETIKTKVRANAYLYSHHADLERRADDLTLAQVEDALLTGEILEQYPDTGRGESWLVVGGFQERRRFMPSVVGVETKSYSSQCISPVRRNLLIRGHEERAYEDRDL
jgi:hypothetical protein